MIMKEYKNAIWNKYKGKFNRVEKFHLAFIICSVILTFGLSNWFFSETVRDLEEQRAHELVQTSKHTAFHFRNFLTQRLDWMSMFAVSACMSEDTDEEWWEFLEEQETEVSRLGIADKDGILHFGDHQRRDVGDKDYFEHAIAGEAYVSRLNLDEMNESDSIALAVPMAGVDGEIIGVVVMEYATLALGEYVQDFYDDDWMQYGANLIIDSQGQLIAPPEGMEEYDTIFDFLEDMKLEKGHSLELMKKNMANEKSGGFLYYNNGERRRLHYMPLGFNDWTVVSIGAMKKYLALLESVEQRNLVLSVVYVVILLLDILAASNIIRSKMARINKLKRDLLTGVYRRREGEKIIEAAFHDKGKRKVWGCLFLDVDDFKVINDTQGHDAGDEVLSTLGGILKSCVRSQDIIYRYGGDEFVIWLFGNGGEKEITEIGQRIQTRMYQKSQIKLSMGGAMVCDADHDFKDVLTRVDEAVYVAKHHGKNELMLYENIVRG